MAKKYSGGIPLGTGLKIQNPNPVADYMVVELISDLTDLVILSNQFIGMTTFVLEDQNTYTKKSTGWVISGGGSFTGGTVTGETLFTGGLLANTISATTYYNLPLDIHTTGFTFNQSNYDLTIKGNNGIDYTQSLGILSSDMIVTGGTYNINTGIITFTNNSGGTFNVAGFASGFTDTYTTGGTYTAGTSTFTKSDGTEYTVTGYSTGYTLTSNAITSTLGYIPISADTNTFVTGGTYTAGTTTFKNNSGNTFTVTGYTTGAGFIPYTGATSQVNLGLFDLLLNGTRIGLGQGGYSSNIVFGPNVLANNTTGTLNIAIGASSLYSNTTGMENLAIGSQAMYSNTTGLRNVGIGGDTLYYNTTGFRNTGNGFNSLYSNTTGSYNTGDGFQALAYQTTANFNTGVGGFSLFNNITGSSNVGIGYLSGSLTQSGAVATIIGNSVLIGVETRVQANNQTNQIVIGNQAIGNGSNSVTLGNDNINKTILKGNIGIGGVVNPTKRLHISGTSNDSGLRLETLTSASPTSVGQPIGVDISGNVVTISAATLTNFWSSITESYEVETTSLTDVVVSGMSITPPAGTYKVDFNAHYDVIPGNVCTLATLDLQNMYLTLLNTPATGIHGLTFGSGEVLTAGVYEVNGAMSVAGTLTLSGSSSDLFIFRVNGAINTAIATTIQLTGGANAANIFFMAIGAVGIGADNVLSGNYIAYGAAAALGANCIFNGRLFSTSGALAFSSGIQSKPTVKSVIEMGILENFLCFTNQGNVANTALAVITGDLGTNFGTVTIFATSVFNGNTYDDTQQLGSTNMFSLYNGTTLIPNSNRIRRYYTYTEDVTLTGIATVNGLQSINVNWRTDVGRCILNNRILTIIKL